MHLGAKPGAIRVLACGDKPAPMQLVEGKQILISRSLRVDPGLAQCGLDSREHVPAAVMAFYGRLYVVHRRLPHCVVVYQWLEAMSPWDESHRAAAPALHPCRVFTAM
jgi:hypothetical protein